MKKKIKLKKKTLLMKNLQIIHPPTDLFNTDRVFANLDQSLIPRKKSSSPVYRD